MNLNLFTLPIEFSPFLDPANQIRFQNNDLRAQFCNGHRFQISLYGFDGYSHERGDILVAGKYTARRIGFHDSDSPVNAELRAIF